MIALAFAALTVPPPPEPITRKTGFPEYAAECLVVGRDGRAITLSVDVRGQLSPGVDVDGHAPRVIHISTDAPELRPLNDLELQSVPMSHVGWSGRWETADHSYASIGSQPVSIKLVSEDDLAVGIGMEVQVKDQMTVPLYAGMCTAKSAKVSLAK